MSIGRRDFIAGALGLGVASVARAETSARVYRVAWLANIGRPGSPWRLAWPREFERHGYVEGRNLEFRRLPKSLGTMAPDELKTWIDETLQWKPDVIMSQFTPYTRIVQRATASIPIVFFYVADAVAAGIVRTVSRPEGNTTGVTIHYLSLTFKRLELLHEILPKARRVVLIMDSSFGADGYPPEFWQALRDAAAGLGLELIEEDLSKNDGSLDEAYARVSRHRPEMILPIGPGQRWGDSFDGVALQKRFRVLVIGAEALARNDDLAVRLGVDMEEIYRLTVEMVARILGGVKPAEIPVHQVTGVRLVINLKAARELGIVVPKNVLARADQVIE